MKITWKIYAFFYALLSILNLFSLQHLGVSAFEILRAIFINGATSIGVFIYAFNGDRISNTFWKVFFYVIILDAIYEFVIYGFGNRLISIAVYLLMLLLVVPAFIAVFRLGTAPKKS